MTETFSSHRRFEQLGEYFEAIKLLENRIPVENITENHSYRARLRDEAFSLATQAMIDFNGDQSVIIALSEFLDKIKFPLIPFFDRCASKIIEENQQEDVNEPTDEEIKRIKYVLEKKLSSLKNKLTEAFKNKNEAEIKNIFSEACSYSHSCCYSSKG